MLRKRFLTAFMILSVFVLTIASRGLPVRAAPFNPAIVSPPKDTSGILVGLDAPIFSSKQYAYVNSANGHIIELYRTVGGIWTWADLTQVSGAPPEDPSPGRMTLAAIYSPQFSSKDYGYFDAQGDLIDLHTTLSHRPWTWTDTFQSAGIPALGDGGHLLGFDSPQFGTIRYIWTDETGNVLQVSSTDGKNWSFDEPGLDLPDPNVFIATGLPITVGFDSAGSQSIQIAYEFEDPSLLFNQSPASGDIVEAYTQSGRGSGTNWSFNDLSHILGAPRSGGGMVGFSMPAPNNKQYAYMDQQGQIQELYLQGTTWRVAQPNLSVQTGATGSLVAGLGTLAGFYSSVFNSKQYAYVDQNGDIQALTTIGGSWHRISPDLTQQTSAPPIANSSLFSSPLIGFDSPNFQSMQFAYVDQSGGIQELILPSGSSQWQRTAISVNTPQS